MIKINEEFLKRAIEYANRVSDTGSISEDRIAALEAVETADVYLLGEWQCLVRGYYDAYVEMSAQKEVEGIPPARISDTERPPVRGVDES